MSDDDTSATDAQPEPQVQEPRPEAQTDAETDAETALPEVAAPRPARRARSADEPASKLSSDGGAAHMTQTYTYKGQGPHPAERVALVVEDADGVRRAYHVDDPVPLDDVTHLVLKQAGHIFAEDVVETPGG